MMDLMNSLLAMGAANGGNTPAAPTNMSQIKVQPQAMDLAGTIPAANAQLKYDPAATPGTDWGAVGKGILGGLAGSMGGKGQSQGLMQPRRFDGRGQEHELVQAQKFSGANMAGQRIT